MQHFFYHCSQQIVKQFITSCFVGYIICSVACRLIEFMIVCQIKCLRQHTVIKSLLRTRPKHMAVLYCFHSVLVRPLHSLVVDFLFLICVNLIQTRFVMLLVLMTGIAYFGIQMISMQFIAIFSTSCILSTRFVCPKNLLRSVLVMQTLLLLQLRLF